MPAAASERFYRAGGGPHLKADFLKAEAGHGGPAATLVLLPIKFS